MACSGARLPPASSASPRPRPRTWSSMATWSRQAARAPNGTRRRGPAKVGLGFSWGYGARGGGGRGGGVRGVGAEAASPDTDTGPDPITSPVPSPRPRPRAHPTLHHFPLSIQSRSQPNPARALALSHLRVVAVATAAEDADELARKRWQGARWDRNLRRAAQPCLVCARSRSWPEMGRALPARPRRGSWKGEGEGEKLSESSVFG